MYVHAYAYLMHTRFREKLIHYDKHCTFCRRGKSLGRRRALHSMIESSTRVQTLVQVDKLFGFSLPRSLLK